MYTVRVIGPGRAGRSMAGALERRGASVQGLIGRLDDPRAAAVGVDVVVLAVPDDVVATVARAVEPVDSAAVVHLSGSLGLDVLAPHRRRGSMHPLAPLPDPVTGARRLLEGTTFAVDGDPVVDGLVALLGGRPMRVRPERRAEYHAAATIAANHVVALMGQVQRVAADAGLGVDAFVALARLALDDVAALGPAGALTGPAARGDEHTLARHRAVLRADERPAYDAGVALARRLAAQRDAEGRGSGQLAVRLGSGQLAGRLGSGQLAGRLGSGQLAEVADGPGADRAVSWTTTGEAGADGAGLAAQGGPVMAVSSWS